MRIDKALNRLKWRLENGWRANKNDAEAVNTIIDFVNQSDNAQFLNNQLSFKMYVIIFAWYCEKYQSDVFDPIPQREMHRTLSLPAEILIEKFTSKINLSEFNELLKEKGINPIEHHKNAIKGIKNDFKDIQIEEVNPWKSETVLKTLEKQFNLFLNTFR